MQLRYLRDTPDGQGIVLGHDPVPDATGFRLSHSLTTRRPHTWDGSRVEHKFPKGAEWYRVEALGVLAQGVYPAPDEPEPPSAEPLWNADLSTGSRSQFGDREYGGTFDGTPSLSERVTVATALDGFSPAQGSYLMRVKTAPGDQYGSSTGWRTLCRMPPESTNGGKIVVRDAGYDSSYTWAVLVPSGWPGDANMWVAGLEWHHTGTTVTPHHFIIRGSDMYVDVFGGDQNNKTTYVSESFLPGYTKGAWYVFTERYKHGLAPNGHYELWYGKKGTHTSMQQLVSAPNIGTMYEGYRNYMLFGQYRAASGTATTTLYFGGYREYAALSDALAWGEQILAGV